MRAVVLIEEEAWKEQAVIMMLLYGYSFLEDSVSHLEVAEESLR